MIYHFTQQNKTASYVFEPYYLSGWQAVAWDMWGGVTRSNNYNQANLTTNNSAFNPMDDDWVSVQFQNTFTQPANAWAWSINGYNTKVEIGVTCSLSESSGAAINYATLYMVLENQMNGHKLWVQGSVYDERGAMDDVFYFDPLTGDAAYSFSIGSSDYITTEVDSNVVQSGLYSEKWFGYDVTRQDLHDMLAGMNQALGTNETTEAGWWFVKSAGINPEIGLADLGGSMVFSEHDLFLRSV